MNNPVQSRQERERAHWQRPESKTDTVWGWQTPGGRSRANRRASFFRELGGMTNESRVLEIGCGTGEFTIRIAPHVRELVATDLTPELVARAEHRVKQELPGANVVFAVEDAMNLHQPDNTFDGVFGCSILHHLDVDLALKEVFRVLKPGGHCVFSEPNMLNPQIAVQKNVPSIKRLLGDTVDETALLKSRVIKQLTQHGYDQILVKHFDFLHPWVPSSLIPLVDTAGRIVERIPILRAISGSLLIAASKPKG